jgi:fluoride ion exporter CrcB/FEX
VRSVRQPATRSRCSPPSSRAGSRGQRWRSTSPAAWPWGGAGPGAGAFTTFSTFSYETVRLIEDGAHRAALRNIAGTLAVGAVAATTGLALAAAV